MSSTSFPDDRSYTDDHEWVAMTPGSALPAEPVRVGITSVAVEALGDLVFIDLPEAGSVLEAGESCGEVESTKTVSDLISPVGGQVIRINSAAVEDPEIVTGDPYGAGWLFEVQTTTTHGIFLSSAEYAEKYGDNE